MLLAILVIVPIVLAMVLKVNAAVLFMSLCVGQILVQYVSNDTISLVTSASARTSSLSESTIQLGLLLLPVVLTAIFMLHSVHGTKSIINLLPAIGFGFLTALFVEPLLSPGFQKTLQHSSIWHQILQAQTLIVGAGAFVALLFLWFQDRGLGSKRRSHSSKSHKL